jgi:cyclic lactone autoinducer peptide
MKYNLAKYASGILMAIGAFFVYTNSFVWHRPETPAELLKK